MEISDTSFLKAIPLLCQPLPSYGKNLKPPLFVKISKTQASLHKLGGGGGPTMKASRINKISAKFLKDGAPLIAIHLQLRT